MPADRVTNHDELDVKGYADTFGQLLPWVIISSWGSNKSSRAKREFFNITGREGSASVLEMADLKVLWAVPREPAGEHRVLVAITRQIKANEIAKIILNAI